MPQYVRRIEEWWQVILRDAPGFVDPAAIPIINDAIEQAHSVIADLSCPPFTLVHGDAWINNFAFEDSSEDPLIAFDWQLTGRMRPGFEVGYFFDIEPAFRQFRSTEEWSDVTSRLLGEYHDALMSCGVRDYPIGLLRHDRRLAFKYSLIASIWTQFYLKENQSHLFEDSVRRWSTQVAERTGKLLG